MTKRPKKKGKQQHQSKQQRHHSDRQRSQMQQAAGDQPQAPPAATMPAAFVLIPRDGLFLKDGREWASSGFGHAHSLHWPFPSTVLAAMRTAFGRVDEAEKGKVLEPADWTELAEKVWLGKTVALRRRVLNGGLDRWGAAHRCWPVPADALFLKADDDRNLEPRVQRLQPKKSKGADDSVESLGREPPPKGQGQSQETETAREELWRATVDDQSKPDKSPLWWPNDRFVRWLAEPPTEAPRKEFAGYDPQRRIQAHVGIDPVTRTHRQSILFAHDVIETLERKDERLDGREEIAPIFYEWAIGCEVHAENRKAPQGRLLFGGSRLPARIETAEAALFGMPENLKKAFAAQSRGLRLVAATPLAFERGWLPDGFSVQAGADGAPVFVGNLPGVDEAVVLRAALVPRPAHVSGWDLARGQPKPTKRLVPAGAVYFFEKQNGESFTGEDAENLWLAEFGEPEDGLLGDWIEQGFGRVVPGVWDPDQKQTQEQRA